jgi:WhiB family redox-sensing transcriptional regulator
MFAIEEFTTAIQKREPDWQAEALCADGTGALVELFFSEQLDDIAAAKAFCLGCPVKDPCLDGALQRREPWGVWGGELFVNGKVVAQKRKRGRPPKIRPEAEQPAAQSA